MKELLIHWCVHCDNQVSASGRDEMVCIRCLRNIIKNNIDEIEQPVNYTGSRYTGGDTMPPFPTMHGAMWKEPQTLEECTNTKCDNCAYYGFKSAPKYGGELPTCEHREALIYVELVR